MDDFKKSTLWKNAFSQAAEEFPCQCQVLETAFDEFRDRVKTLVAQIAKDMPQLTVHDITHLDALWWTASEIAGDDYEINPAEAFVLGGAILLHDASHCIAAYPGGVDEIVKQPEWSIYAPKLVGLDNEKLLKVPEFQTALFDFLRAMHPKQARKLAKAKWQSPLDKGELYLLPNDLLRDAYGDIVGQIAESHWFYPHELEKYSKSSVNPPAVLHPAPWPIDVLKLCILLRTADAAHVNSQRAPKFLFALTNPSDTSLVHWQFQSRIHNIKRDPDLARHEIRITSTPFPPEQQDAWWMAYDIAGMIDKELRSADRLMLDYNRTRLAARSVANIHTPEDFARDVPTEGWQPVDTNIKVTDIKGVVDRFGGERLYGNHPSAALRELIQNSVDAIHACRELGAFSEEEGEIEVSLQSQPEGTWLTVADTGVGMSRHVITDVLLDFGRSLWGSQDLRTEWESLPSTDFQAIGQFGIGFFSIFMLGEKVKVTTRRLESKSGENANWYLEFGSGTKKRPTLRVPTSSERLKRHGTKISVLLGEGVQGKLQERVRYINNKITELNLSQLCARLAPALDINLYTKIDDLSRELAVKANDWSMLAGILSVERANPEIRLSGNLEFSDIVENSKVIARMAIYNPLGFASYLSYTGTGVTRGVRAGGIEGVYGIAQSHPQLDLARKTARPKITKDLLMSWAVDQKEKLIASKRVGLVSSALLFKLQVSIDDLVIGRLDDDEITIAQLKDELSGFEELIIHDGEIVYEEDDYVAKYEFGNWFQKEPNVLEVCDIKLPDWMSDIIHGSGEESINLLDAIIDLVRGVWGDVGVNDCSCIVGNVNEAEISRYCTRINRFG